MTHPDQTVLILDFGSQVTQLIARRVREAGVYCEIVPFAKGGEAFARLHPRAVILSGSPASVADAGSPRVPDAVLGADVPILGICYGEQVLCEQTGGTVRRRLGQGRSPACLDEPWRPHRGNPGRLSRRCGVRRGALCRHRR
jgi:GMP synthase-like glutamine amidotransferase